MVHQFSSTQKKSKFSSVPLLCIACLCPSMGVAAQNTSTSVKESSNVDLETITITAEKIHEPVIKQTDSSEAAQHGDLADLLAKQTGMNVIRHGNQTGLLQVNGLSQERVKLLVDGINITPACPNHMDPPLHYASSRQSSKVITYKQATPVSQSGDSLGSTVSVQPAPLIYSSTNTLEHTGSLGADYNSGLQRRSVYLTDSISSEHLNLTVTAETQKADELKSAKGDVALTGFEKNMAELRAGYKTTMGNEFELSVGKLNTEDAGTPALRMDMAEDDASKIGIKSSVNAGKGYVESQLYYHDIDHVMDNYSLRTKTTQKMRADASSTDTGANISYTLPNENGYVNMGLNVQQQKFSTKQTMLMTKMQRDLIPEASRKRVGIFFENEHQYTPKISTIMGLRTDVVSLNTHPIEYSMMPDMAAKTAFNNADRKKQNNHVDALISGTYKLSNNADIALSLARNTRSPSIIEQYLWKSSKTYAQGDGYSYLGNLDLKPEVSHKLSATFGYAKHTPKSKGALESRSEVYIQNIDDFIQGVATTTPNVLQFQNTDARLFGINQTMSYAFTDTLALDGTLSYVRGKNTKLNDNLYRIAPLSGSGKLTYDCKPNCLWKVSAEVVAAAKQSKVSKYNQEKTSPGYAIMNLSASLQANKWLEIGAGVNNIFDKYYAPHLAGVNLVDNQVYGGHLAPNQKLPEAGRSAFVFVTANW